MPTPARTKFFPHPRQGTRALPYKSGVLRLRTQAPENYFDINR